MGNDRSALLWELSKLRHQQKWQQNVALKTVLRNGGFDVPVSEDDKERSTDCKAFDEDLGKLRVYLKQMREQKEWENNETLNNWLVKDAFYERLVPVIMAMK